MTGPHPIEEQPLELGNLINLDVPHQSVSAAVEDRHLLSHRHRSVLGLDKQLVVLAPLVQGQFRDLVHVGGELGEGLQLRPLGLVYLQGAGHLFHGLYLGAAANPGHADTHVDGGTHALVEEALLQVNLSVRDGNDVGGNIGRNVTGLRFDYRKRGKGSTPVHLVLERFREVVHPAGHLFLVDDAGSPFKKAGMQVENVAGISLAAGRALQYKGNLSVGDGLLGKVVIHLCDTLSRRVQEPGVEFIKDSPAGSFWIRTDIGRLQQVATNFVTNAVKYTHQGHIRLGWRPMSSDELHGIDSTMLASEHAKAGLYIYCEDTGEGVEPDVQDRIFERFFKVNDFMQGTGLGLAICKAIADAFQGDIGMRSEGKDQGCTFWLWVPVG